LRGDDADALVDLVAMGDDGIDQLAGECGGRLVAFRFGEVTLEDCAGGALAEVGLEHGSQGESPPGPSSALLVSLRRHRRSP
jgi:hypothetical protein